LAGCWDFESGFGDLSRAAAVDVDAQGVDVDRHFDLLTKQGLLYDRWLAHFGKNTKDILVVQAPSVALNPTLPAEEIAQALLDDPEAAKADYLSQWRDAVAGYLPRELLDAAIERGVTHRPYDRRLDGKYVSWSDFSDGRSDSTTCAIAHREGDLRVVDAVLEVKAPHNVTAAAAQVAAFLKSYNLKSTMADLFAGNWVREAMKVHKIRVDERPPEATRSTLYSETLPGFASYQNKLVDHKGLIVQYASLERRVLPSGYEKIDHARTTVCKVVMTAGATHCGAPVRVCRFSSPQSNIASLA
jgi:hypothetical protein